MVLGSVADVAIIADGDEVALGTFQSAFISFVNKEVSLIEWPVVFCFTGDTPIKRSTRKQTFFEQKSNKKVGFRAIIKKKVASLHQLFETIVYEK